MKKASLVLVMVLGLLVLTLTISTSMAEEVAKCVQLPVACNSNSDCTCSGCCSDWHVCQPTCHSNPNPEFVLNQESEMMVASADSCTGWMLQPNGCYWRTCVDSQGRQYCEQCCGQNCSRVKCN